ncbi:MAG TPA: MFS transporter [Patescibacteria group bacterium]|nr:MFS transporter [Patescibacteria group bacterium]
MHIAKRFSANSGPFIGLNALHILNDGFQASFVLLLPFIAKDQGLSLTKVGSLGTILSVASVVLALPAGYIAAKIGGLKTLIIALALYAVGLLGAGMFGHYYLLLLTFALGGVGFGVFHPIAFSLIAKWAPKATRGRAMGNFTAIGDVGRIGISAALSFVVVAIGWRHAAIIYAIAALVIAACAYHFWLSKGGSLAPKEHTTTPLSLWQIIRNRRYLLAISASALDAFASASLFVFLPFLLLKRGVDPAFLGTFTAAFFVGNFFGKTILGRFVDKFGGTKVFITSEVLMAAFIFLLANATALPFIVFCSIVLGVFTKGTVPVLQTMVSESVEHHGNFEKAFGFGGLVSGAAITSAPFLLGFASDKLGIVSAFNIMAAVALVAVIPALCFYVTRQQEAHEVPGK